MCLLTLSRCYLVLSRRDSHRGMDALWWLQLVSLDSVDLAVRQQGAVQFKNYVKYNWSSRDRSAGIANYNQNNANNGSLGGPHTISKEEKDQIKAHITDLMLSTPPLVRAQLSEALTIISSFDFPKDWPTLLPQLIEKLKIEDESVLNGVLSTADAIYHRYRGQFMSDELNEELQISQILVRPLLSVLQRLTAKCSAVAGDPSQAEALPVLLSNARLCLSVFFSLNSPGLTEEFEQTLTAWMDCIHILLTLSVPQLLTTATKKDSDQESPLDALKAMACECLSLFIERNEEEFAPYLEKFASDVWQQLLAVGTATGQDNLAMAAISFLTTVARSVHFKLFGDASVLKQVCEGIIVPNLRLRDEDVELFEMNWIDYVRRDTEGSDSDTRRRSASELVRALVEKFPTQTTELFSGYVNALLSESVASPQGAWKSKDTAIYLVSALAVRSRTAASGATMTNELVNIGDFYNSYIAPELSGSSSASTSDNPVIKADCLKFATTFRSQLSPDVTLDLFPKATKFLTSRDNVVHSYAAILIEKLLSLRRDGQLVFSSSQLGPYLQPLLENLFAALKLPDSGENEYVMRAIMRLLVFVGPQIKPVVDPALQQLVQVLMVVARNPTQPGFNHYLFESIGALIRFGCSLENVSSAEAVLFPPFQTILQEDVQEFHPYVFQILAQLVEMRHGNLPDNYLVLLAPLLAPMFWERQGTVPALARLLRAYVAAAAGEIVTRSLLPGILGVFQKLVASKAHDHDGMQLLDALLLSIEPAAMEQYMTTIWNILFQRLQAARTPRYSRSLLHTISLYAAKRGGATASRSMDAVQPGITGMLVQGVLAPTLTSLSQLSVTAVEYKAILSGMSRLLSESSDLQPPNDESLLVALVHAITGGGGEDQKGDQKASNQNDEDVEDYFAGYSAAYAKLHNAAYVEVDPLPEVQDAKAEALRHISVWSSKHPGRVASLLAASPADVQAALSAACQKAGVSIA